MALEWAMNDRAQMASKERTLLSTIYNTSTITSHTHLTTLYNNKILKY